MWFSLGVFCPGVPGCGLGMGTYICTCTWVCGHGHTRLYMGMHRRVRDVRCGCGKRGDTLRFSVSGLVGGLSRGCLEPVSSPILGVCEAKVSGASQPAHRACLALAVHPGKEPKEPKEPNHLIRQGREGKEGKARRVDELMRCMTGGRGQNWVATVASLSPASNCLLCTHHTTTPRTPQTPAEPLEPLSLWCAACPISEEAKKRRGE